MRPDPNPSRSGDLREYLAIVRRRKLPVFLVTVLAVGATLFFSYRQIPTYTSGARVLVRPIQPADQSSSAVNLETERALVSSAAVAQVVIDRLDLTQSAGSLLGPLDVSVEGTTEILSIRYSDPSTARAQRLAQAFADSYLVFRREQARTEREAQAEDIRAQVAQVQAQLTSLDSQIAAAVDEQTRGPLASQRDSLIAQLGVLQLKLDSVLGPTVSLSQAGGEVVEPADLPGTPTSPNHVRDGMLGLLIGVTLGLGGTFLLERLDDRLRTRRDLEDQIGAPVLAAIPRVKGRRNKDNIVSLTDPKSAAAEGYRTLRTNLLFIGHEGGMQILAVTSPGVGEGKTTTAANLAVAMATTGRTVIAVSCDLRRPRLHQFFEVPNDPGLSRVLSGEVTLQQALCQTEIAMLSVIPSGPVPPNPAELLGSKRMYELLDDLRAMADFIVIDAPPTLAVADALVLAPRADAVLLVADARASTRSGLAHTMEQVRQVGGKVVGGVLNNLHADQDGYSSYGRYHSAYYSSNGRRKRIFGRARDSAAN